MCSAMRITMLNKMGMRLAGQGQHRAGLTLLAQALRLALRQKAVMYEARIRNNIGLVLHMAARPYLARRQFVRAMGLVALRVGTDNPFYRLLLANLAKSREQGAPRARQAA